MEKRPHGFGLPLLAIFTLALLVRVLHLAAIRDAVLFQVRIGDGAFYDAWARAIAAGDWVGRDVFWYAPLYPYFLGIVYKISGHDTLVVRVVQALAGSMTCVLLADAGRRLFSRTAGIVAGVLMALYAPAIFYDGLIHKPVLVALFLALVLWLMARRIDDPGGVAAWTGLGAATGGLVLARENTMLFVPLLLLWLLAQRFPGGRLPPRRSLALGAALIAGAALVLAPVATRNRIVGGEFHLTAANFGDNFYKGNNPRSSGSYVPLVAGRGNPEFERQDATRLAEQATGRSLTPSEVSRYWTRQALDFMVSRPGDWLRLTGRKTLLVWNATEIGDAEDLYTYAGWSPVLWAAGLLLHMGTLAPLALLGVWVTWRDRRRLWPLPVMLLAYTASVVAFYVFGRYRYPMVPFLVLFAAAGLAGAARFFRTAGPRARVGALAAVAAMLVFCNWPVDARDETRMTTHWNLAVVLQEQGRFDEAIAEFREGLRLAPGNPRLHEGLGDLLRARGRLAEATVHYRESLSIDPGRPMVRTNLALTLRALGQEDEAIAQYRAALAVDPDFVLAHFNLANLLRSRGSVDEALAHYERAHRVAPGVPQSNYDLGLATALATHPDPARRDVARAIALAERAVAITERWDPGALDVLAELYAGAGRTDEAIATAREGLERARDLEDPRATRIREHLERLERQAGGRSR